MSSSEDTFHVLSTPPDSPAFDFQATPFMPKVEVTGLSDQAQVSVTFNQAFIFDYAAAGKRIEVSNLQHDIGEGKETFTLKITFNHQDGAIQLAEIVKNDNGSATFENFTAQSDIDGDGVPEISPAEYYLELAEFSAGCLEQLYIRENIHLHLRGHYQKFDEFQTEGDTPAEGVGYGVMKPFNSSLANGDIEYRALAEDPRENNDLEIRQEGNNIYFYVQGSDESGSG